MKQDHVHLFADSVKDSNIEECKVSVLGADMGLIALITLPTTVSAQDVKKRLEQVFPTSEFLVHTRDTWPVAPLQGRPVRTLQAAFQGPDQPGLVWHFSKILKAHNIALRDLETDTSSMPFSGGTIMFSCRGLLLCPLTVDVDKLQEDFKQFEEVYGVNIDLDDGEREETQEPQRGGRDRDRDQDQDQDEDEDQDQDEDDDELDTTQRDRLLEQELAKSNLSPEEKKVIRENKEEFFRSQVDPRSTRQRALDSAKEVMKQRAVSRSKAALPTPANPTPAARTRK